MTGKQRGTAAGRTSRVTSTASTGKRKSVSSASTAKAGKPRTSSGTTRATPKNSKKSSGSGKKARKTTPSSTSGVKTQTASGSQPLNPIALFMNLTQLSSVPTESSGDESQKDPKGSGKASLRDLVTKAIFEAQADHSKLNALFDLLDPMLYAVARRIARQIPDDAVQVAKIRIWKKIHKVDPQRPESAQAYVMTAAVTGMRDEVRRYIRDLRGGHKSRMDDVDPTRFVQKEKQVNPKYGNVLDRYINYIEGTGDFAGAHKHVAGLLGVTTARASTMFHEASRDFIKAFKEENK